VKFDLAPMGFISKSARTLLSTQHGQAKARSVSQIRLEPFSVYIGELSK